ncbi:MAG: histidinol-phosphatase HisJ family protein [Clostridia bacterium]|nr:histidinol-phosphatase HisJ family protein [Lachnospiraceae bacterium]NCC00601.1 histidinol-phosphatase HisJ family protein [Clostridia bacterium]NCD02029.1 histidinol-phosphatase HisJ family protein [Clostridia bacterium]
MTSDIHMHSSFSSDSESPMESMIQGALAKGLKTICFTEHLDYEYPSDTEEPLFLVDIDAYTKKLTELREIYKKDIEILYGIEFGLLPHLAGRYDAVASAHDFDFIIGSSHLVSAPWYMKDIEFIKKNGHAPENMRHGDPYEDDFWEGRSVEDICELYFKTISNNIQAYKNFDTYAHIDYVIRYAPEKNKDYTYKKYASILDEALKAIINQNLALEINTAGYKYGLGQPNPQADILKRYRELGGEKITIGADAHKPEHIAYDFSKTHDLLTGLGFKYYTVFKKRQPIMLPL